MERWPFETYEEFEAAHRASRRVPEYVYVDGLLFEVLRPPEGMFDGLTGGCA